MNEKARELGMENTTFQGATGLDSDGHLTTAKDIAIMSRALLEHGQAGDLHLGLHPAGHRHRQDIFRRDEGRLHKVAEYPILSAFGVERMSFGKALGILGRTLIAMG